MTRRRRRFLIATVILAILLLGCWLIYPRIDARFVGSWIVRSPNGEVRTFHLNANGRGTKDVVSTTWTGTVRFHWWVTRGRLVIHYRSDDSFSDSHDYIRSIVAKFTGATAPLEVQEYEIMDLRPDSLLLRFTGTSAPESFQRLPE